MTRRKYIKIMAILVVAVLFSLIWTFYFSSPRSVESFGSLKVGDRAPVVSENVVEYKFLYSLKYKFYIYAMEKDMDYCALEDCGMSGVLVKCMGGWLSADNPSGDGGAAAYGLLEEEIVNGKSSIIVVADQDKNILGIYPDYKIKNIPYILKNYRNIFKGFDFCYDTGMPTRR